MDGIWLKFIILAVPALTYLIFCAVKSKKSSNYIYKNYQKVEGTCSDIKYSIEEIESIEGSYDLHLQSYVLNYSLNGKEYQINRVVETTDSFGHALIIHKGDTLDIWVNPDNANTAFVPKFEDTTVNSFTALVVVSILFIVCGLIIKYSM